jgi:hypothetical protein
MVMASVSTFHDHSATPAALVAARRCFSFHTGIGTSLDDIAACLLLLVFHDQHVLMPALRTLEAVPVVVPFFGNNPGQQHRPRHIGHGGSSIGSARSA